MPLDRENGETLEGLKGAYVVIHPRHLQEMNNLKTEYVERKKFRKVIRKRPIFDDAVVYAMQAFMKEGALLPIRFDEDSCLVQVYPKEQKCAVLFQRMIAGSEHYFVRTYELPGEAIETLLSRSGRMVQLH